MAPTFIEHQFAQKLPHPNMTTRFRVGAALLVLASCASAFTLAPAKPLPAKVQTPTFRLRGGDDASASMLTSVGAGVFAASGAMAWIAPKKTLGSYGVPEDLSSTSMMRTQGLFQLCLAATLLAGKHGSVFASGFGLLATGLTCLMNIPIWDQIQREKPSQVAGVAVFALLGKLTLDGRISAKVAGYLPLLLGLLIHFTPVATAKLYQLAEPISKAGLSMLALYGSMISLVGVYLGSLAYGLALPQAFAATFAVNGAFALKWALTEAKSLGAPMAGGLVWAALSAAMSALALK